MVFCIVGVAIEELGPPIDQDALVRLDLPQAELGPDKIGSTVLYVDSFGNVALNVTREGYVTHTQNVVVRAGQPSVVTVTLRPRSQP